MSRAFFQSGQWQIAKREAHEVPVHGKATLRGSALAGLMTLALFALPEFRLPEAVTTKQSAPMISAPELVSHKAVDRVPYAPEITSSFTRQRAQTESETATSSEAPKPFPGIEIVDGLTLRAGPMTVRIAGLASPEANRICRRLDGLAVSCVDRATSYLELLVKGRTVACDRAGVSDDGIEKGRCRIGETDIAEQMIRQGWARAEGQGEQRLVVAEAAARKQKLGIWRE
jgi:endonuclease YncB( thermonuclease family)